MFVEIEEVKSWSDVVVLFVVVGIVVDDEYGFFEFEYVKVVVCWNWKVYDVIGEVVEIDDCCFVFCFFFGFIFF